MADDKKPKIDLKARLGKTTAAPAPAPVPVPQVTPSGRPIPMPTPSQPPAPVAAYASAPAPQGLKIPTPVGSAPGSLPIPSGYGPPAGFNPSNPLAAAVASAPYQQQRAPAPPEPQRIEIDELTIRQATSASLKKGIFMGCGLAVMVGVVAYVFGGSQEQASNRAKAKEGAVDLATNVGKAKEQLKLLSDKMEAGKKSLITDKKFPDTLARDLGAINVDFDGKQLAGRRFSGFSTETTGDLVEFITAVQNVNDRKQLIQGLLTKLEKPISEQLKMPEGQVKISYVVAVDRDQSGNVAGLLSRLVEPIVSAGAVTVPPEFTFVSGSSNVKLPAFKSGDIGQKPAAIYVVPKSFESVCPAASSGQIVQLGAQIGNFINEVKGESGGADPNAAALESKPGLLERADKLIKELGTVGS